MANHAHSRTLSERSCHADHFRRTSLFQKQLNLARHEATVHLELEQFLAHRINSCRTHHRHAVLESVQIVLAAADFDVHASGHFRERHRILVHHDNVLDAFAEKVTQRTLALNAKAQNSNRRNKCILHINLKNSS